MLESDSVVLGLDLYVVILFSTTKLTNMASSEPLNSMAVPLFTLQDVLREELDDTLFQWLRTLTEGWSSALGSIPPNSRAPFAFAHIGDPKIKASLLILFGGGNEKDIAAVNWTKLSILLSMYVKGMHRRADNG